MLCTSLLALSSGALIVGSNALVVAPASENRTAATSLIIQGAMTKSVNVSGAILARADGDEDDGSSMSLGAVLSFVIVWMVAGLIIFYVNGSREETPEFGVFSCFCAICCFPVGCLACCLPLDSPGYAFFSSSGGENRRLLGRGTTVAILTEEATITDALWFHALTGILYLAYMAYAVYAGVEGIMAADACPAGFTIAVLLLAKAAAMFVVIVMQAAFSHLYKDQWTSITTVFGRVNLTVENKDEESIALRSWLKTFLQVQRLFFLFSICCTSGLAFSLPDSSGENAKADEVTCAAKQADSASYFISMWAVLVVISLLYLARERFRGYGSDAKDYVRDLFLKQAHLWPL